VTDDFPPTRYDRIGHGYANRRAEDPELGACIEAALGPARSVLNVGAGTGAYEPKDRYVLAIEPSDVMEAQRPRALAPALRLSAGILPLRDGAVEASMAVLTVHHWDEDQERGVREMRRVTQGPVVVVTIDPEVSARMWLMADYMPEVAALDRKTFPPIAELRRWLGGQVSVQVVPIHRDTPDRMLLAFWAHPEWVVDAEARAATSGFSRMPASVMERVVEAVAEDLASGAWDARNGHLRSLIRYDAGLRVVVAHP